MTLRFILEAYALGSQNTTRVTFLHIFNTITRKFSFGGLLGASFPLFLITW
jgi:hypothetical protein